MEAFVVPQKKNITPPYVRTGIRGYGWKRLTGFTALTNSEAESVFYLFLFERYLGQQNQQEIR